MLLLFLLYGVVDQGDLSGVVSWPAMAIDEVEWKLGIPLLCAGSVLQPGRSYSEPFCALLPAWRMLAKWNYAF